MVSQSDLEAWLESDGSVPFDLYSQNDNDWEWLREYVPGVRVSSAGGILPFQAEGLLQGYPFYYREEQGSASLAVGEKDGEAFGNSVLFSASMDVEETFLYQEGRNFAEHFIMLVASLKQAPFLWKFPASKIVFVNDGSLTYTIDDSVIDECIGWGNTPEEAYEYTQKPSSYLLSVGWSEEFQRKMWEDSKVSPVPLNSDERVFDIEVTDFIVRLPQSGEQ